MSRRCAYLSIIPDSTIRKKPSSFRDSTFSAACDLFGQVGLLGKFLHAAALEKLAVQRAIHVAGVQTARADWRVSDFVADASSSVFVMATCIAGVAKACDVIDIVLAFGAGGGLAAGNSPLRRPSAHQAWRRNIARRSRHRRLRRRVCATIAAGVASSISVLVTMPTARPSRPLRQAGDGFDPRIIERILRCGQRRRPSR